MDKIIEIINMVTAFLSNLSPTVYVVGVFIVEAIVRLTKTEKPISILLAITAGIKKVIVVVNKICDLLIAIDAFLNKIIPQKTKAE